ncbi:type II toxin-antitoxin system HipA family toxin [Stutzerimonas stutzeri]|uniref:type II toxin-antitoxin system HipA family toxin n=1 Tax=Stutzerimonas stutzeri TaxID=316 RepID=UPI00265CFB9F|nr:type II toxin-antitoxin system HipA family toxin [Stutzerimonas stutzeri]MCF6783378.1 type II toxin-antitoxin system HipA family toxin [Stutzerimonas stutzeri]
MSWTPISKAYVFATVDGEQRPMGVLAKDAAGFHFGYAKSWLAYQNAFSADPLNLPLSQDLKSSRSLWGCFVDATPDNWGRKVILATHKQAPANEIEWLLVSRGTGSGCLSFSASRNTVLPAVEVPHFSDLAQLLELASDIEQGQYPDNLDWALAKLLTYGSSMGGARPKITALLDGQQWIAKLSRHDDVFNQPRAEFASLMMAHDAGIPVPDTQLLEINGQTVLLVRRFDRDSEKQAHYLSANALIAPTRMRDGDVDGPVSYLRLATVIQKVSKNASADLGDLFRRIVFNIAIGNTDDHLKNHGFIHQGNDQYRLSPAFDLLPHPDQTAELALVAGALGRAASFPNALSMCERFGLTKPDAASVIREVVAVTSRAANYFRDAGMSPLDVIVLTAACNRSQAGLDEVQSAMLPSPAPGPR